MRTPLAVALLQVTAADVGRMLRADALNLVLGLLLLAVALSATALYCGPRRGKEPSLPWFALFTLGYGARLLARTDTFPLLFNLPPAFWDYMDSILTYVIPVPLILVLRTALPSLELEPLGFMT